MGCRGLHDLIDREGYCRYNAEIVGWLRAFELLNFYRSHYLLCRNLCITAHLHNYCERSARFELLDLVGCGAFRPHMEKGHLFVKRKN